MRRRVIVTAALCLVAPTLALGQVYVYPQQGQSSEQQQRDQGECHQWAVQQTGYNPGMASTPSSAPDGSLVRGGALIGGMRRRDGQRQQEQAQASGQQAYQRAYGAFLQGRAG